MNTSLTLKLFAALLFLMTSKASAQRLIDTQLEKEVAPIINSLEKLQQLKPVSFYYNKDEIERLKLPAGKQYGFLTTDVQAVFPELINTENKLIPSGKNTFKNSAVEKVNLESLIPLLVSSVKEQQAEIERLKEEISLLKQSSRVN